MLRPIFIAQSIFVATVLIAVLPSAPSFAVTAKKRRPPASSAPMTRNLPAQRAQNS
jgi:hypothetical protein